jgi:hypothetical protein
MASVLQDRPGAGGGRDEVIGLTMVVTGATQAGKPATLHCLVMAHPSPSRSSPLKVFEA